MKIFPTTTSSTSHQYCHSHSHEDKLIQILYRFPDGGFVCEWVIGWNRDKTRGWFVTTINSYRNDPDKSEFSTITSSVRWEEKKIHSAKRAWYSSQIPRLLNLKNLRTHTFSLVEPAWKRYRTHTHTQHAVSLSQENSAALWPFGCTCRDFNGRSGVPLCRRISTARLAACCYKTRGSKHSDGGLSMTSLLWISRSSSWPQFGFASPASPAKKSNKKYRTWKKKAASCRKAEELAVWVALKSIKLASQINS